MGIYIGLLRHFEVREICKPIFAKIVTAVKEWCPLAEQGDARADI